MIHNFDTMRELIDKLNYYTKLYDEGHPIVSDKQWDDMYFQLQELEEEFGAMVANNIISNDELTTLQTRKRNIAVISIASLTTVHNRKDTTIHCLKCLFDQKGCHNDFSFDVYLTDDGCTDGTAKAVTNLVNGAIPLHIIQGDGSLFWAGGMRRCWKEALKRHKEWDYYLLLNDDVELQDCMFEELIAAQHYVKNKSEQ